MMAGSFFLSFHRGQSEDHPSSLRARSTGGNSHPRTRKLLRYHRPLMVMRRFSESNPEVEDPQAARKAADERIRQKAAQCRIAPEQVIVSPLQAPRQDDQQHSHHPAEDHE